MLEYDVLDQVHEHHLYCKEDKIWFNWYFHI